MSLKHINSTRIIVAILLSAIMGSLVYSFIHNVAFTNVDSVQINYETDSDTIVRLYYGNGRQQKVNYSAENSQALPAYAGAQRLLNFQSKNKSLFNARLETGNLGMFTIYGITVFNRISNTRHKLTSEEIKDAFQHNIDSNLIAVPNSPESGELVIKSVKPGSLLRFHYPRLQGENPIMLYGLTIISILVSFVFALRFSPSSIPAIGDVNRKQNNQPGYRLELDGLRGIAALLVLLEHTWWRFAGSGATGVWIFFALSGYLLSQPFIAKPERATDIGFLVNYIFRRLARILPMYYFTLILIFGITKDTNLLLGHMFFLQAEGHLWTIPQEVFFYLALPFIVTGLYFLRKLPPRIFLALMAITVGVFLFNPTLIGIRLYGYDRYTPPYLGWFMCGMLVAYVSGYVGSLEFKLQPNQKTRLSAVGVFLLLGILVASSTYFVSLLVGKETRLPTDYKAAFVIASSILMIIILACPGTLLSRIFCFWPLRAIGIVGYSYYLLHPMIIDAVMEFSRQYFNYELLHGRLFVVSGIVTWLACLLTYSLIERPFLLKKQPPHSS
jgi:peptidoglycan/LPS O-acetylase OafA/YrhL